MKLLDDVVHKYIEGGSPDSGNWAVAGFGNRQKRLLRCIGRSSLAMVSQDRTKKHNQR